MKNNKLRKYRAAWSALLVSVAGAAIWLALPDQTSTATALLANQGAAVQNSSKPASQVDAIAALDSLDSQNTAIVQAASQPQAQHPTSTAIQQPSANPRKPLPAEALAELMRRKLTPAMRREINQHLRPDNQPPRVRQSAAGTYVDLSDRASSVMIAIIDDNNNTVVADITRPIATE